MAGVHVRLRGLHGARADDPDPALPRGRVRVRIRTHSVTDCGGGLYWEDGSGLYGRVAVEY